MNPFRISGTIDSSYEKKEQQVEVTIEKPKLYSDFYQLKHFTVCDFSKNDFFTFKDTKELVQKIEKFYGKISFVYLQEALRNDYDIVFKMLDGSKIILQKCPDKSFILHKQ